MDANRSPGRADDGLSAADREDMARASAEVMKALSTELEAKRSGAQTILTAAGGLAALYTGVLGLVFSASDNPLPLRGIMAPLFLGVALVCSTTYLAWVKPVGTRLTAFPDPAKGDALSKRIDVRLQWVAEQVSRQVRNGSSALRIAVVALAFGLVCISLPFLQTPGKTIPGEEMDWPIIEVQRGETDRLAALRYAEVLEDAKARRSDTFEPDKNFDRNLMLWVGITGLIFMAAATLTDRDGIWKLRPRSSR